MQDDSWGLKVQERLIGCFDLVAAEALQTIANIAIQDLCLINGLVNLILRNIWVDLKIKQCYNHFKIYATRWNYAVKMERFAALNIHGFGPMKFLAGMLLQSIGQQCLL